MQLLDIAGRESETPLAVMQIARRTDDRYRDLSEKLRRAGVRFSCGRRAPDHFVELVRRGGSLDTQRTRPGLRRIAAEGIAIGVRGKGINCGLLVCTFMT